MMDNPLIHAGTVFMGFFAIMNPISNVPIFLGLTDGLDDQTTRDVALRSLIIAFLIVAIFAVAGKMVFELFGITMPAFRITGGILVFLIGYHMLQGKQSRVHQPENLEGFNTRESALGIAVSPLAMPILAGPGTIATAMNFSAQGGYLSTLVTVGVFASLCLITFACFLSGKKIIKFLGTSFLGVITRMMGLILAVIGVQMVIEGVRGAIKLV
jgi:multiple antibiotic resistance protein